MQKDHNTAEHIKERLIDKMSVLKKRIEAGETILCEDRIQVCVLADSPTVVTGFGNVCREILTNLYNTGLYAFEIVGINYDGTPHDFPFKIWPAINALIMDPAYREAYGRQKYLDLLGEGRFDIAWVLQDSFIVAEDLGRKIQETNAVLPVGDQYAFMFYFPIDATPKKAWIDGSAREADVPIVYTEYGFNEILKLYHVGSDTKLSEKDQEENKTDYDMMQKRLSVVYHGVNTSDFHPIEDQEKVKADRQKLWGRHADKFIFMNVNRNQPRKDLFRTLQAFKILLDSRRAKGKDDVYLYMHCNIFDNNLDLIDMCKQLNLTEGDEWAHPNPAQFGPSQGFPIDVLNEMYNSVDAVVTTTLGEGWGLSITEAMATKKPIIAPDHTSISEILGRTDAGTGERGILVKTKGEFVQQFDNSRARPITDPYDMAEKMEMVVENREVLQPMVDSAYAWVKKLEWGGEAIMGKWTHLFEVAYRMALTKRALHADLEIAKRMKADKLGRNDTCTTCNKKVKHCIHGKAVGV